MYVVDVYINFSYLSKIDHVHVKYVRIATTSMALSRMFLFFHLELEPEHLREERRCVLNSTQKLAFNNYMTFIQTAECTREVFKDVSHMIIT